MRIVDIQFKVNPIFWLVVLASVMAGQFLEIMTLFGIVIIHEIGHVFAAKSYGWQVTEIELLPFGGVAKMNPSHDAILEELMVAIAGPLQNLMMIFVAYMFQRFNMWSSEWTTFFIEANIWIGVFNLLPIAPLDGYKVIKSFLFLFLSYRKAVMSSLFFSSALAIIFLIGSVGFTFGMKINMNGLIIAIFLLYSNWVEIKQVPYQFWNFLLHKVNTKQKRNVSAVPVIVQEDILIIHALRLLRKDRYHLYYILSEKGEMIGVLPEEKVLQTIFNEKELYQPIHAIAS